MKPIFLLTLAVSLQGADFPVPYNSERSTEPLMPAEEAAHGMAMPTGFRCTVFASEPDVQNPIAMAWDPKGRMWIAENYTYAGGSQHFDLGLRDRVIILEDKDNDGRAESRKVFTDGVQMLTSVEIGRGGVWLMCPPQLLFVPDRNADDVPDGPAEVVLDGFTVAEANYHNFANGLRWGPEGWLYGRCGHSCPGRLGVPGTPNEMRVPIQGGLWRYHPERKLLEVLTYGTTNPWGHDWDANGECFFINTVTGHLWHLIPGSHLKDSNPSPNAAIYDRLDTIADHSHFDAAGGWKKSKELTSDAYGGGHAHIGMMIYQGDAWPESYRGQLFTLNMHGRRTNVERLERLGCGYVGRHQPDLFQAVDPYFRGLEISTGPDGNAFIIDWSDIGECHEFTGVHRTSGRVFKISHGDPRPLKPMLTPHCLMGTGRLPMLWKQYQEGKTTRTMLRELLADKDEHVRVWAIRLITDFWPLDTIVGPRATTVYPDDAESLVVFERMAREDPSGLVRLALASTLQRLPLQKRQALAIALVSHREDVSDGQMPAMIWFGVHPLADEHAKALVSIATASEWPDLYRWTSRRLIELTTLDREIVEARDSLLTESRNPTTPQECRTSVLRGLSEGLKGVRKADAPQSWELFAKSFNDEHSGKINELRTVFGDGRALDEIKRLVLDPKADVRMRQTGLKTLIDNRPADLQRICETALETRELDVTAVRGLALFGDVAIAERILKRYRTLSASARPAAIDTLTSRGAFASQLLKEIAAGKIARADLATFHARQIQGFNDVALSKQLRAAWGDLHESAADKVKLIQDLKTTLNRDELAKASLGKGRELFQSACAACHTLYGEGAKIGPDLTGSGRANLDYLLENIVEPSAVVSVEYRNSTVTLADGRVLAGLMTARTKRTLSLRTLTEEHTVELSEVVKEDVSPLSMMPEGLLLALQLEQVRDLIAYLMHPVQVPLLK
ncbi:MAG: c-type cytochrome [Pedosphaera sp.]|nr:c-type cytochrome [Pedosphaera sp.]